MASPLCTLLRGARCPADGGCCGAGRAGCLRLLEPSCSLTHCNIQLLLPALDFTVCMCLQPPNFYDRSPPAPPGLIWWQYTADVPPLPPPTDVNPAFVRYGWRYDPSWHPLSYIPNSMDLVSHHPHALPALSELRILLSVGFCLWQGSGRSLWLVCDTSL